MRREHDVGALQPGVDEGFVLKHIESCARDFLGFQGRDEGRLIHDRPARRIDKKGGALHAEEAGREH